MSNEQNNNSQQNEEVVSILKRLSELLDNSVSLEDAIAMAKQQKEQSPIEDNSAPSHKQDNTKDDNGQLSFDITDESVKEPDEISALDYIEPENTAAEPDKPLLSNEDNELIARLKAVVHGTPDATVEDNAEEQTEEVVTEDAAEVTVTEQTEEVVTEDTAEETVAEQTEEVVTEDTAEGTVAEQTEEVVTEDTAEETVTEQTEEVVTEDTAEGTVAEQTEEVVTEDTAEETVTEQTEEVVADTNTDAEPDKNEGGSKVFDEIWAYLGNRTAEKDADTTEETQELTDTEYKSEKEDIQLHENEDDYSEETEEDLENGEENSFIPDDHTVESDDEDDLFSSVFTDERTERKNKEKDRRMWQKQTDGSAILSNIFDWLEVVVLSAAFALLLFTFILRLAVVDGDSMNHTLHDKELLIISDLMYTPDNGDIVVFTSPNYPEPIVKRVIATEGQTVDIDFETWTVTVDGVPLKENYINKVYGSMDSFDMQFPLTVKEGHVFVMGDNRNESLDSRNSRIGLVDVRNILGEVKIRLFPLNRFGKVD